MRGSNTARVDDAEATESPWLQAHRALSRLAKQRASADAAEGKCLLAALRAATHVHLGFGSFNEYVERLFGYNPRSTQEKLRVAEALEHLPDMAGALERGELSWSACRELTRVAVPETEREWLVLAETKTVRQLEQLVAGAKPGDTPSSPRDPSLVRHVLRFEVSAETLALFREAQRMLRRHSDERLDDDTLLLTMARAVLGGPSDDGRSSYQVALAVCPECERGAQIANGELVAVSAEVVGMAACDAQKLGLTMPVANDAHVGANVGAPTDAHVGASPTRAKQTIPPARRRAVLQRDQRRCRVPGCCNATFLDVHHIIAREEGGGNAAENLITLCGAHHRAIHRGELVIEGTASDARFRHADGSRYGDVVTPHAAEVFEKVSAALRNLIRHGARERAGSAPVDARYRQTASR
jgi:5-methylcytosine-specific restriction endonuclease McrA